MRLLKVMHSSNIDGFEYDEDRKVLTVHYHKEGVRTSSYEYYDVMPEFWQAIVEHNGPYGSFVRNALIPYKYAKVLK